MLHFASMKAMRGRDVRRVREQLGMNQYQFAAFLKVQQPTVSDWENDKHPVTPPMQELIRLKVDEHQRLHEAAAVRTA